MVFVQKQPAQVFLVIVLGRYYKENENHSLLEREHKRFLCGKIRQTVLETRGAFFKFKLFSANFSRVALSVESHCHCNAEVQAQEKDCLDKPKAAIQDEE